MLKKYVVPDLPVYILLLTVAVGFTVLLILSEGTYGGADEISHYYFSRYAFRFPSFYLDQWAKPLFTALSAPFARLGYVGFRFFNVLAGTATAYFTWRTARLLHFRYPVVAIFLLISSPQYVVMMLSGMTEILFSLVLMVSIFLFFRKNYGWAALVISFLPFARTEGVVIIPLFLIALALKHQWKVLPLLLSGTLFYTLLGSFHYHDLLWLVHEMPYRGDAAPLYGKGELLHFVRASKFIFGLPLTFLVILGLVAWVAGYVRDRKQTRRERFLEFWVAYLPFMVYFAAHTVLWWRGWGNSLGLIRVMAAIVPPAALLGAMAWSQATEVSRIGVKYRAPATGVLCLYLLFIPFQIYRIPVPLDGEQRLVKEASEWLKDSELAGNRIHYYDAFFPYYLEMDPFDRDQLHLFVFDTTQPGKGILDNEILIWDAHFSPNEGNLPISALLNNPGFRVVKHFQPDPPFRTLGGYEYGIYIFQRLKDQ